MYNEDLSPPTMTDRARRICDELGVCREEAIFYLEAFAWNLDAAMEACRSKTLDLPSLTEKEKASSPEVPSRNELIVKFYNLAVGSDTRDATSYLERNDWDLQRAVSQFFDERFPTASQRKMNRKLRRLESMRFLDYDFAEYASLSCLYSEEQVVPKAIPPLVSSHLKIQENTSLVQDKEEKLSPVNESAEGTSSSMSSSQLTNTSEEKLSQWKEESIKSFFKVAIGASREAAIACLSHCKWNQDDAISYFFGDYTEAVQESTSPVKESAEALASSMSVIKLTDSPDEQLSRLKKELVKSFRDVVIVASRKAAEACLSHCKWNHEDAVSYFFGEYILANPEIAKSQGVGKAVDEDSSTESLEKAGGGYFPEAKAHVKIQEISSPTQTREDSRTSSNQLQNFPEQPSQWKEDLIDLLVLAADGVVNRDVATVYLTLSNWNVDEAYSYLMEEEKSTSSSNAGPTETGNVTVAVPEDATSQVDDNVKDKDVEEGLSSVPITTTTTIELKINLAIGESGTPVWILFRSDQTVRDIRKRIAWFRPEDEREYYLKSDTGVEYRDLDTTVHSITSGSRGSTTLHQTYST
ncbi:unnamed protein product [Eruca vesicaria subsp. sativa]|uniref:Uncharacterized protein n=1 Tax=Eruca vesicaria subsp. sativa TaxID=29727 RepID=A0ABC8M022_ERUVS|nr:unnamed protein product [Eruca vesicaria subsp. sativa]